MAKANSIASHPTHLERFGIDPRLEDMHLRIGSEFERVQVFAMLLDEWVKNRGMEDPLAPKYVTMLRRQIEDIANDVECAFEELRRPHPTGCEECNG